MWTVALLCCACAAYWLWSRKTRNTTEPPVLPGAWPIVGHALRFIGDNCHVWNKLNEIVNEIVDLGGVAAVPLGPRTFYVVTDPDDSSTILNTCLEKDDIYEIGKSYLGEGLLTAKLSIWKNHRKLLNPAFNQSVLDTFMGVFNSQSRKLVRELEKEAGKGPFNHWTYIRLNALETIGLTSLGVDFTDLNLSTQYLEAVEIMLSTMIERLIKFWWYSPYTFAFSNLKRKQDASIKILHNMSNTVIQKRKSELTGNVCSERSFIAGTRFKAFLDLVLELSAEKGAFNDREIREQVDVAILGGHDTSANVLLFTMILLGSYPEAQEKVFTEIQEVLGDGDRDVEKADLSKLVYLEAVLKESMRMFTITPVLARKLDKDVKLRNYTLSAGSSCLLSLFAIHKLPMWGPDVHEFKPERWLEPGRLPDNPNAFAAFSIGRRMCIGKSYALMSMKTTIAHVIRNYRITADHTKLKLKVDVLLKPVDGYYISIEKRT
ncbi:unnamed protein product [Chrysodeixis includens]|uniref:Cytochrome P450 n=1 Tax=Chrysodeixis includens TaxID=689277 RepID=A0A9P0BUF2_CHRIL|nr:unnamed protein product [Chrysodeixis includens]